MHPAKGPLRPSIRRRRPLGVAPPSDCRLAEPPAKPKRGNLQCAFPRGGQLHRRILAKRRFRPISPRGRLDRRYLNELQFWPMYLLDTARSRTTIST